MSVSDKVDSIMLPSKQRTHNEHFRVTHNSDDENMAADNGRKIGK